MLSEQSRGHPGGVGGLVVGALPLINFSKKLLSPGKYGFFTNYENLFSLRLTKRRFLEYILYKYNL